MGCDTVGKIRGYVKAESIASYLKEKYSDVKSDVKRSHFFPLPDKYNFQINAHSESKDMTYYESGGILFKISEQYWRLFYHYSNINTFENLEYFRDQGREDMVMSETTTIMCGVSDGSVELIEDIVSTFGGGWMVDNDCNDEYRVVDSKKLPEEVAKKEDIMMETLKKYGTDTIYVLEGMRNVYQKRSVALKPVPLYDEQANSCVKTIIGEHTSPETMLDIAFKKSFAISTGSDKESIISMLDNAEKVLPLLPYIEFIGDDGMWHFAIFAKDENILRVSMLVMTEDPQAYTSMVEAILKFYASSEMQGVYDTEDRNYHISYRENLGKAKTVKLLTKEEAVSLAYMLREEDNKDIHVYSEIFNY